MAKKSYTIPFIIWIIAGTVIPLISIAYYGFTSRDGGFTLSNITAIFRHDHMQALGLSLTLAIISTIICLVIAFPVRIIGFPQHGCSADPVIQHFRIAVCHAIEKIWPGIFPSVFFHTCTIGNTIPYTDDCLLICMSLFLFWVKCPIQHYPLRCCSCSNGR